MADLNWVDALGWAGAMAALLGYAMGEGRGASPGVKNQWQKATLLGCLALLVFALERGAWPAAATNILWCAVALRSMARYSRQAQSELSLVLAQSPSAAEGWPSDSAPSPAPSAEGALSLFSRADSGPLMRVGGAGQAEGVESARRESERKIHLPVHPSVSAAIAASRGGRSSDCCEARPSSGR